MDGAAGGGKRAGAHGTPCVLMQGPPVLTLRVCHRRLPRQQKGAKMRCAGGGAGSRRGGGGGEEREKKSGVSDVMVSHLPRSPPCKRLSPSQTFNLPFPPVSRLLGPS